MNNTTSGIFFQEWAQNQATANNSGPMGAVWELSIRWQMKGLHVRFDTKLGKWLVMMKNTFTLISDDLIEEESDNDEVDDTVIKLNILLSSTKSVTYYQKNES